MLPAAAPATANDASGVGIAAIRVTDPVSRQPADGFVFYPSSPALAKDIPALCQAPPGVDRARWHRQINVDALAFFRQTLGVATP